MAHKPLEYTIDYLRSLYDGLNNLAQIMRGPMAPSYGYSGLKSNIVDVCGGFYKPNGAEYGNKGSIFLFAKPKSVGKRPNGRNPNKLPGNSRGTPQNPEYPLYNAVDYLINWKNVLDPEVKAKLIIRASKLTRDNPLYLRVPKPTAVEKEWAKDILAYGNASDSSAQVEKVSPQVGHLLDKIKEGSSHQLEPTLNNEGLDSGPKYDGLTSRVKHISGKMLH